jgi:uracil-DNA glycosylase
MFQQLPEAWQREFEGLEVNWNQLDAALEAERGKYRCFPPRGMEFTALRLVAPADVKVIICGQDPYHGEGQAHGLAFSVAAGVAHPPSLRNMLRELRDDLQQSFSLQHDFDPDGVLGNWAREGVLLLNDVLTVRSGEPGSHAGIGWQAVTGAVLDVLASRRQPLAVLLWGRHAQQHSDRFQHPNQRVFSAPHPSPLSAHRGFFGSKPFSKANEWLIGRGVSAVNWV